MIGAHNPIAVPQTSVFCKGYFEKEGLELAPHLGHVSNSGRVTQRHSNLSNTFKPATRRNAAHPECLAVDGVFRFCLANLTAV